MGRITENPIVSVDFVFENCAHLVVQQRNILNLCLVNIQKSIYVTDKDGISSEEEVPKHVHITIHPDANIGHCDFGIEESRESVFSRLAVGDITQLHINYLDGTTKMYLVPWSDDEYENKYQHTRIVDGSGVLQIAIEKKFKGWGE